MRKNRIRSSSLFWIGLLIACQNKPAPTQPTPQENQKTDLKQIRATHLVDSARHFLHAGAIVLRRGNDAISSLFAELNKTDKSYSHCGIAFQEEGRWYVYHSIGGEDNPDARLRRDAFSTFVRRNHNYGFAIAQLRLKPAQTASLQELVKSWYHEGKPFDMQFDLKSDDRLYCAEMLYKAFNQVIDGPGCFPVTEHRGFRYVSTDNIYRNKAVEMLCRINY